MFGLEAVAKYFPILSFVIASFIGYGAMTAKIDAIQQTQSDQFKQISHRLDRIEDRINK